MFQIKKIKMTGSTHSIKIKNKPNYDSLLFFSSSSSYYLSLTYYLFLSLLDNSIRSEQFLNYWRNHTTKFDVDKNSQDNYYSFYNMTKFNSNIQHSDSYKHHHLSNKDIGKKNLS